MFPRRAELSAATRSQRTVAAFQPPTDAFPTLAPPPPAAAANGTTAPPPAVSHARASPTTAACPSSHAVSCSPPDSTRRVEAAGRGSAPVTDTSTSSTETTTAWASASARTTCCARAAPERAAAGASSAAAPPPPSWRGGSGARRATSSTARLAVTAKGRLAATGCGARQSSVFAGLARHKIARATHLGSHVHVDGWCKRCPASDCIHAARHDCRRMKGRRVSREGVRDSNHGQQARSGGSEGCALGAAHDAQQRRGRIGRAQQQQTDGLLQ